MAVSIILLIVGMVLLIKGADLFVDGASKVAKLLKVPSLVIGLTLVSIGTSAPEASVSINSSINGLKDISLGNVVGSNIVNTLLILGISAIIIPLVINKDMKKYDIPIMIGLYTVLLLFAFVITPLTLDSVESIVMLVLFVGYNVFLVLRARAESKKVVQTTSEGQAQEVDNILSDTNKESEKPKKELPTWLTIVLGIVGLAGVIFGGDLVVDNAAKLAHMWGMSESLVGLTIISVGTSLPELVTSIVAAAKKENDIAIGNVIGSNIFNVIFILGLSSAISPLTFTWASLVDMLVMFGSGLIVLLVALFSKKMTRWQGILMVLCYVGYLTFIIIRN